MEQQADCAYSRKQLKSHFGLGISASVLYFGFLFSFLFLDFCHSFYFPYFFIFKNVIVVVKWSRNFHISFHTGNREKLFETLLTVERTVRAGVTILYCTELQWIQSLSLIQVTTELRALLFFFFQARVMAFDLFAIVLPWETNGFPDHIVQMIFYWA